eukprot:16316-Heterococcus_DN1.PRE.3
MHSDLNREQRAVHVSSFMRKANIIRCHLSCNLQVVAHASCADTEIVAAPYLLAHTVALSSTTSMRSLTQN